MKSVSRFIKDCNLDPRNLRTNSCLHTLRIFRRLKLCRPGRSSIRLLLEDLSGQRNRLDIKFRFHKFDGWTEIVFYSGKKNKGASSSEDILAGLIEICRESFNLEISASCKIITRSHNGRNVFIALIDAKCGDLKMKTFALDKGDPSESIFIAFSDVMQIMLGSISTK